MLKMDFIQRNFRVSQFNQNKKIRRRLGVQIQSYMRSEVNDHASGIGEG